MRRHTRRFALPLLVAALLVVAGCTGTTAPAGPTATPPPCEEYDRATAAPVREDVEPKELPERPADLTAETVREFVADYERAYTYNGLLTEDTERVEVDVREVQVSETPGSYRVRVEARWYTWAGGLPREDGNGTTTPIHGDGPLYDVVYDVTDDRLVRHEVDYGETPPPGAVGTTVECW